MDEAAEVCLTVDTFTMKCSNVKFNLVSGVSAFIHASFLAVCLTCRARCTASANASFLAPPAPFPTAACPGRGAPGTGGGTALYSDMVSRKDRRGERSRKPGSELRRSGMGSQESDGKDIASWRHDGGRRGSFAILLLFWW